jgi:hypothetical protein
VGHEFRYSSPPAVIVSAVVVERQVRPKYRWNARVGRVFRGSLDARIRIEPAYGTCFVPDMHVGQRILLVADRPFRVYREGTGPIWRLDSNGNVLEWDSADWAGGPYVNGVVPTDIGDLLTTLGLSPDTAYDLRHAPIPLAPLGIVLLAVAGAMLVVRRQIPRDML